MNVRRLPLDRAFPEWGNSAYFDVELDRMPSIDRVLFEFAKPRIAIVTTPNVEYNVKFEIPVGKLRHPDRRFE